MHQRIIHQFSRIILCFIRKYILNSSSFRDFVGAKNWIVCITYRVPIVKETKSGLSFYKYSTCIFQTVHTQLASSPKQKWFSYNKLLQRGNSNSFTVVYSGKHQSFMTMWLCDMYCTLYIYEWLHIRTLVSWSIKISSAPKIFQHFRLKNLI